METRVARRQTRNKAPRVPSLFPGLPSLDLVLSSSGATLRSQPMVRIAAASLMFWVLRLAIRLDVIWRMAASVCL